MGEHQYDQNFTKSVSELSRELETLGTVSLTNLDSNSLLEVGTATKASLLNPVDFPPVASAIVPGDEVALAIDPDLPDLTRVLTATISALKDSGAETIHLVLCAETSPDTMATLRQTFGAEAEIHHHTTVARSAFRYLGPDISGQPIYINRRLVDADFVLPIVTKRSHIAVDTSIGDITGIYPQFADSEARRRHYLRHRETSNTEEAPDEESDLDAMTGTAEEPAWLLGVQLVLQVTPSQTGNVAEIKCGSVESLRKASQINTVNPASFDLVVATIDGDTTQQTWLNLVRAVEAASIYTVDGGTIVIWSDLTEPVLDENASTEGKSDTLSSEVKPPSDENFALWNETNVPFERLETITENYQVILRSKLPSSRIEEIGVGNIETVDELTRLAMAFSTRGLLRSAQYSAP